MCGAAALAPLLYAPNLDSPFVTPKWALLLVAAAVGVSGRAWVLVSRRSGAGLRRSMALALLALSLTSVISAFAAWTSGEVGAPYATAELLHLGVLVAVATAIAPISFRPSSCLGLFAAIHLAAGATSVIGILQHLLVPFPIPIISLPGSTFGNRNIAAEAVAMSLPFGLGALAMMAGRAREEGARPPDDGGGKVLSAKARAAVTAAIVAVELTYLAMTRTRGAWLGGAIGVAVFAALARPRLRRTTAMGGVVVAALMILAIIVPGRFLPRDSGDAKRFSSGSEVIGQAFDRGAPAARTRLGLWRRTLQMYRERPLLGVGPGNFAVLFPRFAEPSATADHVMSPTLTPRRAHNDLLERFAETGPLGLLALLAVYGLAARHAWRRARGQERRKDPPTLEGIAPRGLDGSPIEERGEISAAASIAAAAAGALAACLGCGLFGFPMAMPATLFLFGVAIGLLGARPARHRDEMSTSLSMSHGAAEGLVAPKIAPVCSSMGFVAATVVTLVVSALALRQARSAVLGSYWLARAEDDLRYPDLVVGGARALDNLARVDASSVDEFAVALRAAHAALRLGRHAEATAAARRALAREPYSPNAWATLGAAALRAGDAYDAAVASHRAIALLADYPGALFTLVRAEARLGDHAAAIRARTRLADLATAHPQAADLLRTLSSLEAGAVP